MGNSAWRKWTNEEDAKLREISGLGKYSYAEMSELLPGRSRHAISFRCQTLGIKSLLIPKRAFTRKYFHNEEYFATKNLKTCYYAGAIMADGYLRFRNNCYDFVWSVAEKDKNLLEEFCKEINYSGELKKTSVKSPKTNKNCIQYRLELFSANKFCYWLIHNFGVTPNKTYRAVVQNFDNYEQKIAFACGLIDGDGSIISQDTSVKTLTISLVSSSLPTIEWFEKLVLEMKLPNIANRKRKITTPAGEKSFVYSVSGVEAAFLYKNLISINVPRLNRKWESPNVSKSLETCLARWGNRSEDFCDKRE